MNRKIGIAIVLTVIIIIITMFTGCKRPLPTEPEWPAASDETTTGTAATRPSHRQRLASRPLIASVDGQRVCLTTPARTNLFLSGGKIGWIFAYATVTKGETCATFSLSDPRDASTSIDAIWLGSFWGSSCCNADQTIWRREGTP